MELANDQFFKLSGTLTQRKSRDMAVINKYTVSGKKVTSCINCHNSGKQCQTLTEFWTNNAMSNCKQMTKFK